MFIVGNEGHLYYFSAFYSRGVVPVFYLSSSITLSGEGTSSNPYILSGN